MERVNNNFEGKLKKNFTDWLKRKGIEPYNTITSTIRFGKQKPKDGIDKTIGWPDMIIPYKQGTLYVELKHKTKLRDSQKRFFEYMQKIGQEHNCYVLHTSKWDEFKKFWNKAEPIEWLEMAFKHLKCEMWRFM